MYIILRLIYETKTTIRVSLTFLYDEILHNLSTRRFYFFNTNIEADGNVNDLFTGSNPVNLTMKMVINKLSK